MYQITFEYPVLILLFTTLGGIFGFTYRCVVDIAQLRHEVGWLNSHYVRPDDNGPRLNKILQQNRLIRAELNSLKIAREPEANSTLGYAFLVGANMALVLAVSYNPASVWYVVIAGTIFNLVMWLHTRNTEPMVLGLLGLSSILGLEFFKGPKRPKSPERAIFDEVWLDA